MGSGTDRWASASIRLVADEPVVGPWQLDVSNPAASGFAVVEGADELPSLAPPFFVRVQTKAGMATTAFDGEPSVGRTMILDPGDEHRATMTQVPTASLPASPEWCDQ